MRFTLWSSAVLLVACAAGSGQDPIGGGGSGAGDDGFTEGPSTSSGLDEESACAKASDEANPVPLAMYIMFDKSGSMAGTKWFQSTAALQAFFQDPQSAGLRVGLRFFPHLGCDEECNVSACAIPQVMPAELTNLSAPTDQQEQKLFDAFVDLDPSGGTPLSAALDGGLSWAQGYLTGHPGEKAVVVLVTDGHPEDCNLNDADLIAAADAAHQGAGVITFAIGLEGSDPALMNGIAHAGGTESAIIIGTDGAQEQLVTALNEIRDAAVACEYLVPKTDEAGEPIAPSTVNVQYTPGDGGGAEITIGQVPDAESCTGKGGWYYDDPNDPNVIRFCPATCDDVQSDDAAKITILLGCATVPA